MLTFCAVIAQSHQTLTRAFALRVSEECKYIFARSGAAVVFFLGFFFSLIFTVYFVCAPSLPFPPPPRLLLVAVSEGSAFLNFIGPAVCMLFIKTSKCFTVHCSFTLPAGAGAVIPVSEGSDGGQRWPVGAAARRKSAQRLWTTLQLSSSLMGSLGGESSG